MVQNNNLKFGLKKRLKSSCHGSVETNLTTIHEDAVSVPCLSGSGIAVSCGISCGCGSNRALLWLWHRPAATSPIWPLAWACPYAMDAALKRQNKDWEVFIALISVVSHYPRSLLQLTIFPQVYFTQSFFTFWHNQIFFFFLLRQKKIFFPFFFYYSVSWLSFCF